MIVAYFETDSTAEEAARYATEELYIADLPRLKALAKMYKFNKVTERYEDI
tara:strand:- start:546 stop:698 length:153 start_codon:yes stop_codon:yes gene_type:complete